MLFPMNNGFVSLDRFYHSIGFSEILDQNAQERADQPRTRPVLFPERARSDGAAFQVIRSASVRLRPDHGGPRPLRQGIYAGRERAGRRFRHVAGDERISAPRGDGAARRRISSWTRSSAAFPTNPSLSCAMATISRARRYDLINGAGATTAPISARTARRAPSSASMRSKARIIRSRHCRNLDPLDIAYLGTVMLEVAGLPLSAAQRERKRLMMACQGRYFGCEPRSKILAFHRRLINSGLVEAQ